MAFIYEINGQRVEFEKEPTEKDIDEAANSLPKKEKPTSIKPKPVEGMGGAAFGVYPQAGRRPESQQDREAALDMPLQTARGIISNIPAIAGIPGSIVNTIANLPRTAQTIQNRVASVQSQLAGNERQPEPELPPAQPITPYDMSFFANLTPGPQPSSPAGQLAFSTGQMVGAPVVGAAANLVGQAGKGAYNFGKGFARGISYPEGTGTNTALAPMRETYVPHEQVSEFMAGQRPASTLTEIPSAPLYENKPVANWAYGMAPENQMGQKLVPYAGRTAEGVGEQIGSQYRKNPITGLLDIGATLATGVPAPISAIARAVPALAARQLQQATQFEPGFGPARTAALAKEGRAGLQANMPTTLALPAPTGPVVPQAIEMPGPQRNVNIEGQSFTLPNQINTSNSQAARSMQITPAMTPKEVSQQVAASKIQQPAPQPTVQAPVIPEGAVERQPTMAERLALMRKMEEENKASGKTKEKTPAQLEREQKQQLADAQKQINNDIISDFARDGTSNKIDVMTQTTPIDISKKVYNESNATLGMAKQLLKNHIDSIPILEGMTESQVVSAIFKQMIGNSGKNRPTKTLKADLGTEIKLPKKEVYDPNNPQQSHDLLTGITEAEKRYRSMNQEQLVRSEKALMEVLNSSKSYPKDIELAKQGLEYIRKYKK